LGEPRESARLKLGLRPSPENGGVELKRILERVQGADDSLDADTAAADAVVGATAASGDASTPGGTT
jgi:hypothetical protein